MIPAVVLLLALLTVGGGLLICRLRTIGLIGKIDQVNYVSLWHSLRIHDAIHFLWKDLDEKNPLLLQGTFYGVSSGVRTHDLQGHNLAL